MLDLARQRLRVAEEQADSVLSAEATATNLRETLDATSEYIRRYELIAMPVEISRVVATLVNLLPESTTLDRIDIKAGTPNAGRSARGRARKGAGPARRSLTGEVSGFAAFVAPVPGGGGAMTVAMLLRNTVDSSSRE